MIFQFDLSTDSVAAQNILDDALDYLVETNQISPEASGRFELLSAQLVGENEYAVEVSDEDGTVWLDERTCEANGHPQENMTCACGRWSFRDGVKRWQPLAESEV